MPFKLTNGWALARLMDNDNNEEYRIFICTDSNAYWSQVDIKKNVKYGPEEFMWNSEPNVDTVLYHNKEGKLGAYRDEFEHALASAREQWTSAEEFSMSEAKRKFSDGAWVYSVVRGKVKIYYRPPEAE